MQAVRTFSCAAAALVCLATAAPANAEPLPVTLASLFTGNTIQVDGLTFSNFKPLLAPTLPSGDALLNAFVNNPALLSNMPVIDPTGGGVFSHAFGNATVALAGGVTVVPLPDNPGGAVDPGLRFDGAPTWSVTAGNIQSLQLTGFFYDVTSDSSLRPIRSADLLQAAAEAVTVGPDSFPSDGLPDIALGSALQFVFDARGTFIDANLTGDLFARMDFFGLLNFSSLASGFTFSDQDSIRVYNLIAVGASSGGAYTLGSLSERYDPPDYGPGGGKLLPPGIAAVPEPGTLLLLALALASLVFFGRREPTLTVLATKPASAADRRHR